jgi:hypothetical protein
MLGCASLIPIGREAKGEVSDLPLSDGESFILLSNVFPLIFPKVDGQADVHAM